MDTYGSTNGSEDRNGDGGARGGTGSASRRTAGADDPGAQAGSVPPPYPDPDGSAARPAAAATTPTVELAISQRVYHAARAGVQDLHAILTVRVSGLADAGAAVRAPAGGAGPSVAEVLVVDCSTSMEVPERKIHAARRAAVTALRALPEGTPFAVVRGTHRAVTAYPPEGPMRPASAATREEAARAVYAMRPGGGTCVGNWLDLAGMLLAEQSAPIPHVLMLTDGRNEYDRLNPVARVLDTWQGRFLCDAWGIGTDWDARLLVDVTRRLHGSANAVHDEDELPAAYEELITRLLARPLPELEIRVTPSPGGRLRYLRQMFPHELSLPQAGSGPATAFTTRAWGNEVRRFQLCVTVDPAGRALDEDLQAAVVEVAAPDGGGRPPTGRPGPERGLRLPPSRPCLVRWTDDPVLAAVGTEEDEHFEKHRRLGESAALAAEAFRGGRREEAVRLLGLAVTLAHDLGAQRQLAELQRIVEIRDPVAGDVSLREGVAADAFEHLIAASTHTTHGPSSGGPTAGEVPVRPVAGLVDCANCRARIPSNARFCPHCRHQRSPGAGAS